MYLDPKKLMEKGHSELHRVLLTMSEYVDFEVTCVFRNKEDQEAAFTAGASEKHWPDGNHNKLPSLAADLRPVTKGLPSEKLIPALCFMGGVFETVCRIHGFKGRWGGDWATAHEVQTKGFDDLFHFEISLRESP